MLKVTFLELFLRFIPESFLIVVTGYVLSKKKIEPRRMCISTIILSISVYLIRLLPIQFGVHTMLGAAVAVFLLIVVNKITVKSAIFSIFTIIIIEGVYEIANTIFIEDVLNLNIQSIITNPGEKVIWFIPSLLIAAFNIYVIGIFINKHEKVK